MMQNIEFIILLMKIKLNKEINHKIFFESEVLV